MSEYMLSAQRAIDRANFFRIGQPTQSTTGVPSISSTHPRALCDSPNGSITPTIGAMARITSGSESPVPTQKRRVRSRSSLSSASPVPAIGTSAMPQIGQLPGASRTICGCIGHVYLAPWSGVACASSAAGGGSTALCVDPWVRW
jgi:hypothetical protein